MNQRPQELHLDQPPIYYPTMALPSPTLQSARAVLNLSQPLLRRPDQDDLLIAAARPEFPIVVARQLLPVETPLTVPHLVVQSTASRAAISAIGAEFETRFYGDYETDPEKSFQYLRKKLHGLLTALQAVDATPSFAGVITVSHLNFAEQDLEPARYLAEKFLQRPPDVSAIQDTSVRLAMRYEDEYFISVTVANYEIKSLMRPVFGAQQLIQIRPWDGKIEETGIEIAVDVNNRLAAQTTQRDPEVRGDELDTLLTVVERVTDYAPRTYVDTTQLDVQTVLREPA